MKETMTAPNRYAVLFVCMGNICRSPTAHGVFRQKLVQHGLEGLVLVDSAGTLDYHQGNPPDERAQEHALKRGYDLSDLQARQIHALDFAAFDLILVMDWDNLEAVQEVCPSGSEGKVKRLTEFCLKFSSEVVPDPYYGGAKGFEHVLDLVEDACDGVIAQVKSKLVDTRNR